MTTTTRSRSASTRPTEHEPAGRRVRLPFVPGELRLPEVHIPRPPQVSRREVVDAVGAAVSFLPPPERLAYYAGLGALAVLDVIDWPVAVAIGAGTVIAQRARRERGDRQPNRAAEAR